VAVYICYCISPKQLLCLFVSFNGFFFFLHIGMFYWACKNCILFGAIFFSLAGNK
jgi:hypothetical protein